MATQDHSRQGMTLPEAHRRTLVLLGGVEPSRQLHRESRGLPRLDGVVQNVRYAVRGLRRSGRRRSGWLLDSGPACDLR